jgi:WD40 repeat protein
MRLLRLLPVAFGVALAAGAVPAGAPPVTALAFSPDGAALVSSGYGSVVVRSAATGAPQRKIACGLAHVHDLAFSADGRLLAAAGGTPGASGAVALLDWPSGQPLARTEGRGDVVSSVAFSQDGARVALGSIDRRAAVYRVVREAVGVKLAPVLAPFEAHAGPVLTVAFSPDGATLLTAGADRALKAWEVPSGKLLQSFTNHTGAIHAIAFRPAPPGAEPTCATASDDRTVRVWQPRIGRMVRIVRGHEGPVFTVAYRRDGNRLFSAGAEGLLRTIEADSDAVVKQEKAAGGWIYRLAVSPDGARLASGDWSGAVRLWKLGDTRPAEEPALNKP